MVSSSFVMHNVCKGTDSKVWLPHTYITVTKPRYPQNNELQDVSTVPVETIGDFIMLSSRLTFQLFIPAVVTNMSASRNTRLRWQPRSNSLGQQGSISPLRILRPVQGTNNLSFPLK